MHPHMFSARLRPAWSPSFWIVCMVLPFGTLKALIPSPGTHPKRTEGRMGPDDSPFLPGVLTTPLTTASVTAQDKTGSCEDLCPQHESRSQCYETFLHICGQSFGQEMAAVNTSDWCIWDQVKSPYNKYTMCTEMMAECLLLPWPNRLVEEKFVEIHSIYFQECHTETLRDPPPNIVFALVMTPICLIPAMVVLVVLKTKNGDRRS